MLSHVADCPCWQCVAARVEPGVAGYARHAISVPIPERDLLPDWVVRAGNALAAHRAWLANPTPTVSVLSPRLVNVTPHHKCKNVRLTGKAYTNPGGNVARKLT